MFLFPRELCYILSIISLGIYSTPKLSQLITSLDFTNITTQCVPVFSLCSKLMTYAPFFNSGKLFLKNTPLNLFSFEIVLYFKVC